MKILIFTCCVPLLVYFFLLFSHPSHNSELKKARLTFHISHQLKLTMVYFTNAVSNSHICSEIQNVDLSMVPPVSLLLLSHPSFCLQLHKAHKMALISHHHRLIVVYFTKQKFVKKFFTMKYQACPSCLYSRPARSLIAFVMFFLSHKQTLALIYFTNKYFPYSYCDK